MKNILIPLTIFIVIFISSCGGEEETSDVINCVDKYDCPETMQFEVPPKKIQQISN